jgi:cytochrome c oxidase cbb3-type subunit 3
MSDFTHGFWPIFISVLTVLSIVGTWIFLKSQTTRKLAPGEKPELMEHTWDGDLRDLNNPLPRWWLGLFYGTLVFALAYLALWPGLGNYAGMLKWTQLGEYEEEVQKAEAKFQPVYAGFMQQDVATVAADADARAIGKNLFLTYCSQCHGSDAAGARGFPNLTDGDWLYGGDPDTIKTTLTDGRGGAPTAPRKWRTMCCRCRAASTTPRWPPQVRRSSPKTAPPATCPTAPACRRWARPTSPTRSGCMAAPKAPSSKPSPRAATA